MPCLTSCLQPLARAPPPTSYHPVMERAAMLQMYMYRCTDESLSAAQEVPLHYTSRLCITLFCGAQVPSAHHRSTYSTAWQPFWALWTDSRHSSLYMPPHRGPFSSLAPPNLVYSSFLTKTLLASSVQACPLPPTTHTLSSSHWPFETFLNAAVFTGHITLWHSFKTIGHLDTEPSW